MSELREAIVFCFHCDKRHIDQGEFAEKNHSMHLCEHCGRRFFTKSNVGVAEIRLETTSDECSEGLAVWPATKPIFDNRKTKHRASNHGYHVHGYADGGKVVDGTFDVVILDGELVAERQAVGEA